MAAACAPRAHTLCAEHPLAWRRRPHRLRLRFSDTHTPPPTPRLCSFVGSDLHGRVLAGALLSDADLSGANLTEAVLTKVGGCGGGRQSGMQRKS